MWPFTVRKMAPSSAHPRTNMLVSCSVIILIGVLLAACGGPATAQTAKPTPTPTTAPTPTPTPIPPTPTPTPIPPTPTPVPTQAPPPPPPRGPIFLDLTPASMSFVGHLDCPISNGDYVCHARVSAPASNPGNLNWTSFVNFANNVFFSPGSSSLPPGHFVDVFIHIPTNDCTRGLFFFRGPANTHTITWAC